MLPSTGKELSHDSTQADSDAPTGIDRNGDDALVRVAPVQLVRDDHVRLYIDTRIHTHTHPMISNAPLVPKLFANQSSHSRICSGNTASLSLP